MVGRKYIRLYAPEHTPAMHPREGLLSNNSTIDLDALRDPGLAGCGDGGDGEGSGTGGRAPTPADYPGLEGRCGGAGWRCHFPFGPTCREERSPGWSPFPSWLAPAGVPSCLPSTPPAPCPWLPSLPEAPFADLVLEAGQMLYIPPGWWHYLKSLSPSFSVSVWWR